MSTFKFLTNIILPSISVGTLVFLGISKDSPVIAFFVYQGVFIWSVLYLIRWHFE